MNDREPFPVTIEFVHGPSDGATFRVPSDQLKIGEHYETRRSYHVYRSRLPWNGVATWVKLYDRGHASVTA